MSKITLSELNEALLVLGTAQKKAAGLYDQAKAKIVEADESARYAQQEYRAGLTNAIVNAVFPWEGEIGKTVGVVSGKVSAEGDFELADQLKTKVEHIRELWPLFSTRSALSEMEKATQNLTMLSDKAKRAKGDMDLGEASVEQQKKLVSIWREREGAAAIKVEVHQFGPSRLMRGFVSTTGEAYPGVEKGWDQLDGGDFVNDFAEAVKKLANARAKQWEERFKEKKFFWFESKQAKELKKYVREYLEKQGKSFEGWLHEEATENLEWLKTKRSAYQEREILARMNVALDLYKQVDHALKELPNEVGSALRKSVQKQLAYTHDGEEKLLDFMKNMGLPTSNRIQAEQLVAKVKMLSIVKRTTESVAHRMRQALEKTESQTSKVSKGMRRNSGLKVDVDVQAIKSAAKGLVPQAQEWLKQVGLVLSGVAMLPEQKSIALEKTPKFKAAMSKLEEEHREHQKRQKEGSDQSSQVALQNTSSSSSSDGPGFWEMYLWYNLMTPSAQATPNATTHALMDTQKEWSEGLPNGLDLSEVGRVLDSGVNLDGAISTLSSLDVPSQALEAISWSNIDQTLENVGSAISDAVDSGSSSSMSSCSGSSSSCSSCGGGGD
jgi:hypothetical protein